MEIFQYLIDHVVVAVLIAFGSFLFVTRKSVLRKWRCFYYRKYECRVSYACLLVIKDQGKYLLIRNINRHESFGPIGGVYKYFETAKPHLDALQFRPQRLDKKKGLNDLRGFIPTHNLDDFDNWFRKSSDREIESISREIKEELNQIQVNNPVFINDDLKFRFLRSVEEGPHLVKEMNYVQFRRLDIYDLFSEDRHNSNLINFLKKQSKTKTDLIWVTADEIKQRRTNDANKNIIGSYCGYIIGENRTSGEDVHYK